MTWAGHADMCCILSTWVVDGGESRVSVQTGLHNETHPQKAKKNKKKVPIFKIWMPLCL